MANSIQAAMQAAGLAKRPIGTSPHRQYGRTRDMRSYSWEHCEFGELQVAANFNLAAPVQQGANTWCRLVPPHSDVGCINCVKIGFSGTVKPDVRVLVFSYDEMSDMSTLEQFPPFKVPLKWDRGHLTLATTKGRDRDIVFLKNDGTFVNYEVSVVIRKDQPYVCGQEIYCGQVVVMTIEEAQTYHLRYIEIDGTAVTAVPLYDENAYPDHQDPEAPFRNYLDTLPSAEQVLRFAYKHGAYITGDTIEVSQWNPHWPDLTEKQAANGWKKGVVTFFNLVIGYGFIICEDGKPCFVHFKNIIDENGRPVWTKGNFPILQPMHGVLLRWEEGTQGRKATSVQVA